MIEGRLSSAQRVLVTQSYFLRFDPKLLAAAQPAPPLGSLICAAVLRERGHDVHFFDAMLADSETACDDALVRSGASTLVIFEDSFNYLTKMCLDRMREAATKMIEMARHRGVEVIVSGSDASDDPGFYLKAGASAVAVGEGELTVAEWLDRSMTGAHSILGIVALDVGGRVVRGLTRPPIRDLDSIPSPAWDLIDVEAYRRVWMSRHRTFSLPLATSRGCPFHCNWCAKPIWGQRYNAMSPARAAREVALLKSLGATQVNVVDDVFGLKPGWLDSFTAEVGARGAGLPLRCLSRADLLTADTVTSLAAAGTATVWIGAESGSQTILDAMEKGTTVDEIRAAARRLQDAGIKIGLFLQFGYPGEGDRDIAATVALVEEVLPDDIGISISYPLPGTRFHDRVKDEMRRSTHWKDSSDLAMLFDGRHGTAYYRRLHAYVHARFRLARARRVPDGGHLRRVARILRYGASSLAHSLFLKMLGWSSSRTRLLAPELSRSRAATPASSASPLA